MVDPVQDATDRDAVYVSIAVASPTPWAPVVVDGEELVPGRTPHVTLFTGEGVLGVDVDWAGARARRFAAAVAGARRRLVALGVPELSGPPLLVTKGEGGARRRSVIVRCVVPGVDRWYAQLEDDLGETIERPPLHVTVLHPVGGRGIGISTEAELRAWARPLGEARG